MHLHIVHVLFLTAQAVYPFLTSPVFLLTWSLCVLPGLSNIRSFMLLPMWPSFFWWFHFPHPLSSKRLSYLSLCLITHALQSILSSLASCSVEVTASGNWVSMFLYAMKLYLVIISICSVTALLNHFMGVWLTCKNPHILKVYNSVRGKSIHPWDIATVRATDMSTTSWGGLLPTPHYCVSGKNP